MQQYRGTELFVIFEHKYIYMGVIGSLFSGFSGIHF
jgi:hypothetical protein